MLAVVGGNPNAPCVNCTDRTIGNPTARRLTVVWSCVEIVRSIDAKTDAIRSSVCRNGSVNAVCTIRGELDGRVRVASLPARSTALPMVQC